MIFYWLVLCLLFLTHHLPLKFCYWVASVVGDLVYICWRKGRRNVLDNMRHVLGPEVSEKEIRHTTRRSFRNYLKLLVDFARITRTDPATLEERLKGKGWENLDKAFQHGKGVILVASHMGSWDVAGLAIASRGYPVNAVSETLGNERMNRLGIEFRAKLGIELIPMEYALKRIFRALRRNEAVGLVTDRPLPPDEGTSVEFFGQRVAWPTGPAVLALRTGAKIITGYLARNADNDYIGEMYPPLDFEVTGDEDADVQSITQQIVRIQEDLIRRFPDQWYMFRRMWPKEHEKS
jgi:lauroyl/myristoyl acyltransferase